MIKLLFFAVAVSCLFSVGHALSCLPCNFTTCPPAPDCGDGTIVKDVCGCCDVCSKQRGETCGGPWDIAGVCDPNKNLTCYKFVRKDELAFNLEGTCMPNGTQDKCSYPQTFTECASACQPSCEERTFDFCTLQCVTNQCVCGRGYIRRSRTDHTCIPEEECGPTTCNFPKRYSGCATACPPTCGNPNPLICIAMCDPDPCVCEEGYIMKSLTNRTCIRAFECEDYSFCEKECPELRIDDSPCKLQVAWNCALGNYKCRTYQWKMEMEKWWTESCEMDFSDIADMWKGIGSCDTLGSIKCTNPEKKECEADAFGCMMCECTDGKYTDVRQLLPVWQHTYDTYKKYMEVYKKAKYMCDLTY